MTEEQTYFDERNVKVTNVRAVIGSNTYAMNNIDTVQMTKAQPSLALMILLVVFGVALILIGILADIGEEIIRWILLVMIGPAFIFIGGGMYYERQQKESYSVRISSTSGEQNVLTSTDTAFILSVVDAMNDAIVSASQT